MKDVGVTTSRLSQVSGSRIALIVQPSNAESPTPMYILWITMRHGVHNGLHLQGAFPLLWFWLTVWICEIPTRQTQSVQKTPFVCMCPASCEYPKGFQHLAWTFAKIGIYFYTSKLFGIKMWKIIFHKACEREGESRDKKKGSLAALPYIIIMVNWLSDINHITINIGL